ncbi:Multidrug resistance-associated protein 1 [Mortierella claussenii]|nr:Multidrug resistance-associated protein 1 [Mortierella claussenii]
MLIAAVFLNREEHTYEIRSSTAIFAFYVVSIGSTVMIIRTHFDLLPEGTGPSITPVILFSTVLFMGFVVEAWPRGSTRVQQSSTAPDYDKANIFSRLVFYHYQPVVSIGLRRTLTAQDIANLLPQNLKTEKGYKDLSTRWNARVVQAKRQYEKHNRCQPSSQSISNARFKKSSGTSKGYRTPSLFWTVMRTHAVALVPIVVCRIVIIFLSYLQPLLLSQLLSYLQNYDHQPFSFGIMLACGMFLISLLVALLYTYNRYQMFLLNVATKAALISMIYRKALRLSPGSRMTSTTGEITNHMAVDAEQWGDAMIYLSAWVSIPIEITVALWMLYRFLGWSMIAGFLGMLLLLPLQAWQARVFESIQDEKLTAMDQRVRLTIEVLAGIRVVRLYGWSAAFLKRILSIRQRELEALRRIGIVQAFMSIVFISSSLIISLITFGVYALWGGPHFTPGQLTPQTVFVSMTLFALLKGPIASLSEATTTTISVVVGTRRIQEFLEREEVEVEDIMRFNKKPRNPEDPLILIRDASFTWAAAAVDSVETESDAAAEHDRLLGHSSHSSNSSNGTTSHATLKFINLSISDRKLTSLVGRVGQGKSSLLSAIIGEMYKVEGSLQISGTIAYVPQQAWIINATLRDNILFGNDYQEERYRHILFACGLEPDLAILPAGDLTEIGERGINLSGGQKQRVSLARAAYADADIYLLDDPLSAVDAHVDRHLWKHLIGPKGWLKDKARVLVTHGIHHLKEVDRVVVLKEGQVVEQGEYEELMKERGTFYQLIKEYSVMHAKETRMKRDSSQRRQSVANAVEAAQEASKILPVETELMDEASSDVLIVTKGHMASDALSFEEVETSDDGSEVATDDRGATGAIVGSKSGKADGKNGDKENSKAELIAAEKMVEGQVTFETGLVYIRALSYKSVVVIVALFIIAQACLVSTSLWLKHWIKESEKHNDGKDRDHHDYPESPMPSTRLFLGVYALLTILYVVIYVGLSWLMFAIARIRASQILHRNLITKILRLPMSFFDTTPLGRILNRFSSDFASVDDRIPNKFFDTLYFAVSVSSTFLLILFTTPAFAMVVPFLLAGYWAIQVAILRITTTLTRIHSASKSPIYQHFSESLNGVSTIRAMAVQNRFVEENGKRTDRMANNFLANMTSKRWVEVQLRLLSTLVLLFAAVLAVLGREHLDASLVGLTLSFTMSITEEVTSLVRIYCDLQTHLVAVERVVEYTDLKTEAPEHTSVHLPPHWPSQGHIRFNHYSTRYREGLDLVLKDISIEILPGQSVGIVGRTGAGKSSLTLALFRIIEAAKRRNDVVKTRDPATGECSSSSVTIQLQRDNGSCTPATQSTDGGNGGGDNGGNDGDDESLATQDQDQELEGQDGGSIEMDGIDISTVGLEDLRKSLAIIPQDPTLFAGTVRENLDPFQELTDASLWEALERSHLKDTIRALPGGLSFQVSQNGDNFSVGQRSLICLARALLRKTKVLIMDEATAAVDVETDELIQKTIRKEFWDRTVLTIAHRIKTVMDSDKILVLEGGRVKEFEAPGVLLKNKESLFFKLAEQAGEV